MSIGIFDPVTINGLQFRNRLLRSSVGGRTCGYDGTVTDVWKNFEKRFADGGLGGIISTTFHVKQERVSPLEYPSLAQDRYVKPLRHYIREIRSTGCRYIVQIGDPGYACQTSLFPRDIDAKSSSGGFDFVYGYNNRRIAMTHEEIEEAIDNFANTAQRVQDVEADGIEITATKGYLIHQFLNPGLNRRTDEWGGDADRRFEFLRRIVTAVRARVGPRVPLGIRMSWSDFNATPLLFQLARFPWPMSSQQWHGNDEKQMLDYATRLHALGVDFLHIVSGYGFPNPRDVPGPFPTEELRLFFNATRHLTAKAWIRAALMNFTPGFLMNISWKYRPMLNLEAAIRFKEAVNRAALAAGRTPIHVIVNGGFQERQQVQGALDSGADMVSMARALIANPDLPNLFRGGANLPARPCTHCNRCVGRTGTSPLGCYEPLRYDSSYDRMFEEIMEWNRSDPVRDTTTTAAEGAAGTAVPAVTPAAV
jgi:2,4-dienoyl-CoA reductase-like NADH-dependent reductase (Old Yellow Enzyme family)